VILFAFWENIMRKLRRKGHYLLLTFIFLSNVFFFQNCENGSFDAPQVLNLFAVKSAYTPVLAVNANEKVGTVDEPQDDPNPVSVGYIDNGDSLTFRNIDFENGAKSVTLNLALVKEATFDPNSKVAIR